MSQSRSIVKSDLLSSTRTLRKNTQIVSSSSTNEPEDDGFLQNDQDEISDESDWELLLKIDDRTIDSSKDKKRYLSHDNDEILYEESKSSQTSGAGRNKRSNASDDDFTRIFEIMHRNRNQLLDFDVTKSPADAEFWQTCLNHAKPVGLNQMDDELRPRMFSSWSSFKQSMLRKIPKQGVYMDGKTPMRYQFSWWWSFHGVDAACQKIQEALISHYTESVLMEALEIDNPESIKKSIFNEKLWELMERRRKTLHQPHCKTRGWSEVPDDHVVDDESMDVDFEDERSQSPSLDPNAIPSIEHDVDDSEFDGAQENLMAPQSLQLEPTPIPDPEMLERLQSLEDRFNKQLISEEQTQICGREWATPVNRDGLPKFGSPVPGILAQDVEEGATAGLLGSPILGSLMQDPGERVFHLTSETPISAHSSRESTSACCTPPSSSPPLTASSPKQFPQLLGASETPSSPKAVTNETGPPCLHGITDYNMVPTPASTTTDYDNAGQEAGDPLLARYVRGQTHPELRQENEENRRRRQRVGRGEIDSNVSHLVARTMLKHTSESGNQGKDVAPDTSGVFTLSLRTSDPRRSQHQSSSHADNKAAVDAEGYATDATTESEKIFSPWLKRWRVEEKAEAEDAAKLTVETSQAQDEVVSESVAVITTDGAASQGSSEDEVHEAQPATEVQVSSREPSNDPVADAATAHLESTSEHRPKKRGQRGGKKRQRAKNSQHPSPIRHRKQQLYSDNVQRPCPTPKNDANQVEAGEGSSQMNQLNSMSANLEHTPRKRSSSSLAGIDTPQISPASLVRAPKKPKQSSMGQNEERQEMMCHQTFRRFLRNRNRRVKRIMSSPRYQGDEVAQRAALSVMEAFCQAEKDSEDEEGDHH